MTHRAFTPPHQRRVMPGREPGTLLGPTFLLPAVLPRRCYDLGPRIRIDGRWLNPVRASHRLYVSRIARQPREQRPSAAQRKRWRIDEFIGGDRRFPF